MMSLLLSFEWEGLTVPTILYTSRRETLNALPPGELLLLGIPVSTGALYSIYIRYWLFETALASDSTVSAPLTMRTNSPLYVSCSKSLQGSLNRCAQGFEASLSILLPP